MKTILTSVAALLCVASPAWADITVTGHGKIKYTPNIAYVTVTAASDGKTAAEAWQKNGLIVQKMFDVLKEHGFDERDYQTAGVHVTPIYDRPKDKAPVLVGYTVSYDLSLNVRDMKKLGKILDRLVEAGANRGMSIGFGMENPEDLMDQARLAAVLDARRKAEIYVKGAGGSLGTLVTIHEGQFRGHKQFHYEHLAMAPKSGDSTLPIAAGQQELEVIVTVTYTINNSMRS